LFWIPFGKCTKPLFSTLTTEKIETPGNPEAGEAATGSIKGHLLTTDNNPQVK
jgi:hypothetical protein